MKLPKHNWYIYFLAVILIILPVLGVSRGWNTVATILKWLGEAFLYVLAWGVVIFIMGKLFDYVVDKFLPKKIKEILDKPFTSSHSKTYWITINIFIVLCSVIAVVILITNQSLMTSVNFAISYPLYEASLAGLGSYVLEDLREGEMKFEYPVYLFPSSTEVLTLTITPGLDAGTDLPDIFQRIKIPGGKPLKIGEYYDYYSNILVAPEMRATLTSEGIKVTPLSNSPKQVTNNKGSNLWSWIIVAPEQVGTHPLYLSLFLGDNEQPIWSFSFTLSVTYSIATPTPTATITPVPTLTPTKTTSQQLKDNFVEAAPTVVSGFMTLGGVIFTAIMVLVGTVLGAFIQSRMSHDKKSEATSATPSTQPPPSLPSDESSQPKSRGRRSPKQ